MDPRISLALIILDRMTTLFVQGKEALQKIQNMSEDEARAALPEERKRSEDLKSFFDAEMAKTGGG